MYTLTVAGINEINESLARANGYRAEADALAAYSAFIASGEAAEIAGQPIKSARSAEINGRKYHAPASHPSGGLARRSYMLAALVAAGFVVVGAKGARIPRKNGDAAVLRFLAPRGFQHWRSIGRFEESAE